MNKLKKDGDEFLRRMDALGLKRGELAVLLDRGTRILNFYVSGERRIPPDVWVTLENLEKLNRDSLARKVVEARKHKMELQK